MNRRALVVAIVAGWLGAVNSASAQTVICPITPGASTSNTLCANTAFVHKVNPAVHAFTVATLPAAASNTGMMAYVTDGTAGLSWGATVTGGHSTVYLVWSNGTNWTVVGE